MIKIEAHTLEEAYSNAATKLQCSVTELVVEVVQYPSSGFLGLFRKKAVIVATKEKGQKKAEATTPQVEDKEDQSVTQEREIPSFVSEQETDAVEEQEASELNRAVEEIVAQIDKELKTLFSKICFELDEVKVSAYDENTLYVEINGPDAALLIGKEGYRYKALSYMIFNWINANHILH